MDTNKLIIEMGYHGRADFGQVAKFASTQQGTAEEIRARVIEKFGPAAPARQPGMMDKPASYMIVNPSVSGVDESYGIESDAIEQLKTALRTVPAIAGAIMPDGHQGYALPIGGVVNLDRAVSPSYVGYDIGCMMYLTIFKDNKLPGGFTNLSSESARDAVLDCILKSTSFGLGAKAQPAYHPVMEDHRWNHSPELKKWKGLAQEQLGSSGAGK